MAMKPADLFALQLKAAKIPHEREVRFSPPRRWRLDFLVNDIAIEIDGGTWTGGRHVRGAGYEADCEKLNTATAQGLRVLRFTSGMVRSGEALAMVERVRSDGRSIGLEIV